MQVQIVLFLHLRSLARFESFVLTLCTAAKMVALSSSEEWSFLVLLLLTTACVASQALSYDRRAPGQPNCLKAQGKTLQAASNHPSTCKNEGKFLAGLTCRIQSALTRTEARTFCTNMPHPYRMFEPAPHKNVGRPSPALHLRLHGCIWFTIHCPVHHTHVPLQQVAEIRLTR